MLRLPSSIVVLNGTSSVGKSSIARALQEELSEPYMHVALDHLFDMVPPPWGGGRAGPLSVEGFRYHEDLDANGRPVTTIRYGEVGRQMLWAFHRAVATLAGSGCRLVVDTITLDRPDADDLRMALRRHDVVTVGLTAPIDVLEARERRRGQRAGLARGHLAAVDLLPTDLVVDTATATPRDLACEVIRSLTTDDDTPAHPEPQAG